MTSADSFMAHMEALRDAEQVRIKELLLKANPFLISNNKDKTKKLKSIKPKQKGDMDMKNIVYIPKEKRYIGRKQINKQIIVVHAKTQLACYNKLKEKIDKLKIQQTKTISLTAMNFKTYAYKWFEQDRKPFIAESTQKDILNILKLFEPLYDLPLNKIDKDKLICYLNEYEQNRRKEKMVVYLKAIFKSAVANRLLKYNPFDIIRTAPRQNIQKEAYTYDEQVKIINRLKDNKLYPVIILYLITGLRKSELDYKNIEKNINFDTMTLKAVNLKGRNLVKRYKHIRLTDSGVKLIMNNLDIFHSMNDEEVYREFYKINRELGIKKSIVNLRHTFATNHLYLGTPEYVVAKEMGHSTSQITKEHYMNLDYSLSKDKILKLYNNLYPLFI